MTGTLSTTFEVSQTDKNKQNETRREIRFVKEKKEERIF